VKKEERTYRIYLEDIQIAMGRIAEYIEGYAFIDFKRDYKTVDAVIRNFEIMRNKVSHEYFGIDYEIIWDVAYNYLPENKIQIDDILENEKN